MKRTSRIKILFGLCMIVALTLACQLTPQTPAEILASAKQNMGEVQTFHIQMDLTISAPGTTITVTAEGDGENPDKAYMTMELMGQQVEILMLSSTEAYTRMAGQVDWTPSDPASLSQSTGLASAASQLQITDYAMNIVKQPDVTIDGLAYYDLTMDVDAKKMMEVINSTLASQITFGTEPAHMEVWVGKKDMLIHKLTYDLTVAVQGQSMDMSMVMTLSKFNEAVEFPTP